MKIIVPGILLHVLKAVGLEPAKRCDLILPDLFFPLDDTAKLYHHYLLISSFH